MSCSSLRRPSDWICLTRDAVVRTTAVVGWNAGRTKDRAWTDLVAYFTLFILRDQETETLHLFIGKIETISLREKGHGKYELKVDMKSCFYFLNAHSCFYCAQLISYSRCLSFNQHLLRYNVSVPIRYYTIFCHIFQSPTAKICRLALTFATSDDSSNLQIRAKVWAKFVWYI